MFNHSIKVPRLYKNASKIAKEVSEGKGSIKQLVYESKHTNIKGLYALIVHTFQRTDEIDKLLKKSKLLNNEPRFDPWLAKILIAELLWGKKRLTGDSKPVKTILGYEQIFKAHLSDVSDLVEAQQVEKPRYVRINTLKLSVNEAVEGFREEGWVLKRYTDVDNYLGFLEAVSSLNSGEFMIDLHVPCLLIFPPKTQFYQHPAYKNGSIILQDKASCLPVHILNPSRGATIMDMCAAPGMKTTQTAAAIENEGVIYAVEIGTKRFNTLTQILETSGATCAKPINRDVLTMTGHDCPNVEYIIVDPSCSGSGLTDRIEIGQQKQDDDKARLSKLAGFQIKILRHALTRFPRVNKVVYSTCSVYPEENEDVVRQVLETCTRFKLVPANEFVRNAWLNYGSPEFGDIGNYCLYAKPDIDLTSGFFVAVFERLKKGECNQFLNAQLFPAQARVERKRKVLQRYLDQNPQSEDGDTKDFGQDYLQVVKNIKIENDVGENEDAEVTIDDEIPIKKEKKRKKDETDGTNDGLSFKKKEKKHKRQDEQQSCNSSQEDKMTEDPVVIMKKKKKKHTREDTEGQNENKQDIDQAETDEDSFRKKEKKHKKYKISEDGLDITYNNQQQKEKKHKCKEEPPSHNTEEDICVKVKKRKNKHKDSNQEHEQEVNQSETQKKKKKKKEVKQ